MLDSCLSGVYCGSVYVVKGDDGRGSSTAYSCWNLAETPLHVAAKFGNLQLLDEIIRKRPNLALQLNKDGYTPLHLACWAGHSEIVSSLIQASPKLCLAKDRYGRTPLHTACLKGRLGVIKELLGTCPQSVMEVTEAGETPLHVAVTHDQIKVVKVLIEWLKERIDYPEVVNRSDCCGNTLLHLATSRKQLQTIKFLLSHTPKSHTNIVDVNALNNGGFTALDILDVLPQRGKIDIEIEKLLRRAGAVRSKDKIEVESCNHEISIKFGPRRHQSSPPLCITRSLEKKTEFASDAYNTLLLIATLMATVTFQAALNPPEIAKEGNESGFSIKVISEIEKQRSSTFIRFILFNSLNFMSIALITTMLESPLKPWLLVSVFSLAGGYLCTTTYLFILFNSLAFFTSIALITIIVWEFPLKPWVLVSVFSFSGGYLCTVRTVSPHSTRTVSFLGGLVMTTAFLQCLDLHKLVLGYLKWANSTRVFAMGFLRNRESKN